jgi:hypothetical protein
MRFLKKLFITLVIIAGLIALGASLVSYYYQNEVKQFVKSQINRLLASPVDVNSIDFSVLEKFPNASVSLSQVLAWDAFPNKKGTDTLFYADKIYFEFNLLDLIQNSLKLTHIEVYKADINLRWNKKGENNYVFWKVQDKQQEKQTEIDLESVKFTKCRVTLDNRKNDFLSWYVIKRLEFKARIESGKLAFDIKALSPAFAYRSAEFEYESKLLLDLKIKMDVDNAKKEILFQQGKILLGDFKGDVSGEVNYDKDVYDFNLTTTQQKLANVLAVIPRNITDKIKGYDVDAKVKVGLNTGNKLRGKWETRIVFSTKNGTIKHRNSGITVEKLGFEGDLTLALNTKLLNLNSYSGEFSGSLFNGELMIKNFQHPQIDLRLKGLFDLERLLDFMELKNIDGAYGKANVDFRFIGRFEDPENIRSREIEKAITNGKLVLNNLGFSVPSLNMKFDRLNGVIVLDDNDATIKNLTGNWKGAESRINGTIRNLMPFILFKNQKLYIRAEGDFDHIKLENFLTSNESQTERESFQIPCFLDMELKSNIGKLTYKEFRADQLLTFVKVRNCKINSEYFTFLTAGGKINGDFILSNSSTGQMNLSIKSTLSQINIDHLFRQFDNFGQKIFKSEQIKGKLTADIFYKGSWDKDLTIDLSSIEVDAIVNIDDGELINVKSLNQIGEYLRENTLTNSIIDTESLDKKLSHIKFDQMTNRIKINNRVIQIPVMTITSSALDINVSGTHDFDNNIDYKLNFRLRQLVKQRKETEFGTIEDDGLGMRIFMTMSGTTANPVFSMDKAAKKSWKKDKWKDEGENINTILNTEIQAIFGNKEQNKTFGENYEPKFELEWDDSTKIVIENSNAKTKDDSLKKKTKKFILEPEEDIRDTDDDDY